MIFIKLDMRVEFGGGGTGVGVDKTRHPCRVFCGDIVMEVLIFDDMWYDRVKKIVR